MTPILKWQSFFVSAPVYLHSATDVNVTLILSWRSLVQHVIHSWQHLTFLNSLIYLKEQFARLRLEVDSDSICFVSQALQVSI